MKLNEEKIKSTFTFTLMTLFVGAFLCFDFLAAGDIATGDIRSLIALLIAGLISIPAIVLFLIF